MSSIVWNAELARNYDEATGGMFAPEVIGPAVDVLAALAGDGAALEFAAGTGRIALPLAERGVPVTGIELSPHMAAVLAGKPGGARVPVTVGDMTTTRVPGEFSLVYLVFNTIGNVTTQDEQVAVFQNAAGHLVPGGRFVVEVGVPQVRRVPPGENRHVFDLSPDHVGIDTYDDLVAQLMSSHHWSVLDGQLFKDTMRFRYVWPSELDLMARLAGMRLEHRWAGWDRSPFTSDSESQVAVYVKA